MLSFNRCKVTMNCAACRPMRQYWKSYFCPRNTTELTWSMFCVYYHFSLITCGMGKSWRSACRYMWAGQQVLRLLRDTFMQSKLSLTQTLTRGNCDYNSNSEAVVVIIIRTLERLAMALHACRNVARRLNRIETIKTIEHRLSVNCIRPVARIFAYNCSWFMYFRNLVSCN